jgi:acyl carrier protein
MLRVGRPRKAAEDRELLDELVLLAVASAGGLERASLARETPLLEANVDSLTLIGLLAGLELELGIVFSELESMELVDARNVGDLCAAVARKVAAHSRDARFCPNARDSGTAQGGGGSFNGVERLHGEGAQSVKEDDDGRLDDVDA